MVVRNEPIMEHGVEDVYKQCRDAACRDDDASGTSTRDGRVLPPNRRELGRAGWLYLHSMAASFPENPTDMDNLQTKAWCYSFASLYPCHICRDSLIEIYKRIPPITNSRRNLLMWTYDVHNSVNLELSYPTYKAAYEDLVLKYGKY